jgi:hypothetical protein
MSQAAFATDILGPEVGEPALTVPKEAPTGQLATTDATPEETAFGVTINSYPRPMTLLWKRDPAARSSFEVT